MIRDEGSWMWIWGFGDLDCADALRVGAAWGGCGFLAAGRCVGRMRIPCGWASCFSNPEDSRKARGGWCLRARSRGAAPVPRRGPAPSPREGPQALSTPFFRLLCGLRGAGASQGGPHPHTSAHSRWTTPSPRPTPMADQRSSRRTQSYAQVPDLMQ